MQVHNAIAALAGLCASAASLAQPLHPAPQLTFEQLATRCAPDVHPETLKAVVRTESSGNPYAIGVVGGQLVRQPRSLGEAAATARELERQGLNFSMGLGQVNRHNLAKYGETYDSVFEPCRNLKAGGAILKDCFLRAKRTMSDEQHALRAALSCYYSGNFTRGFRSDKGGQPSYVQKVAANASGQMPPIPIVPAIRPQSTDGTVAMGLQTRPAPPVEQGKAPSQWVTVADNPREPPPRKMEAGEDAGMEPAVKVRLAVPDRRAAPLGLMEQTPLQPTGRARPTLPNNVQQEPTFVQFVN